MADSSASDDGEGCCGCLLAIPLLALSIAVAAKILRWGFS